MKNNSKVQLYDRLLKIIILFDLFKIKYGNFQYIYIYLKYIV